MTQSFDLLVPDSSLERADILPDVLGEDEDLLSISSEELAQMGLNEKWRFNYELEKFVRSIPKVELHVHFDGSFDFSQLHTYLTESGNYQCLPDVVTSPFNNTLRPLRDVVKECKTLNEFKNLCTCRGKRSLYAMFQCFDVFLPIVRDNLALLETLAHDFVKGQAQQNVIYTEVRYCPHLFAKGGFGGETSGEMINAEPIVDAITRGFRSGEKQYGVKVNQILCCISFRPDWTEDIIRIAHARRSHTPCAVVGIDLAAGEEHFDAEKFPHLHKPHFEAFCKARELNLNITMHAGEVGDATYIKRAVDLYGAKRIGHGYRITTNAALMHEMREKNIHFEVCPTSSDETGGWMYDSECEKDWSAHPAALMIRHGMNVGFNSDDPSVFNTSLSWQLRIALGKMNLSKKSLVRSLTNSLNAAFVTEEDKYQLHKVVDDFIDGHKRGRAFSTHNFIERVPSIKLND